MPIYEYRCRSCGKVTEMMESITSVEKVKECPACKGEAERIMSVSGFQLKGGGWHDQGYSKSPSCASADSASPKCASCPAAAGK
ncbi:MAG: zinc ribbon domain-containing protein [Geovibrio sp.]|uniref:FmdB family zinc ribbon protein n=1 Tax=Geovibrio ferrireducens TaxID=46201 RepID=UPI002246FF54|nr:zinc ribbon domain-containing protein [Geovibrio ferrireducens]MCD8492020.1 zinc ribbon domain-containing protein [Geovibrio sp.]MCD8568627.1 zinc ribbon domain-containing protein [Geovibrio sp.]